MLASLVGSSTCARVKKRVYMPEVADEFNSSSQPLNAVVLASILSMMSPSRSSKKLREGYVVDLAREGGVSPCALMLGLLYIKRLSQNNPDYINLVSPRDLFLVSMVVASKYMNDEGEMEALTNSDWAKLGCMTKTTLDDLERNFLSAIDWRLYVPLEEYYNFVNSIEARIALDQASRRGWFTYTDLTAVWEATDIQSSMLLATKQTAKVATKGAALYLMCVATLFAASGTLPLSQDITSQLSTPTGAIDQLTANVAGYLGHTPSAATPPRALSPLPSTQQMFLGEPSAIPNFDQMETVHRKQVSDGVPPLRCRNVSSHDNQFLSNVAPTCRSTSTVKDDVSNISSPFIMGGHGRATDDIGTCAEDGMKHEDNKSDPDLLCHMDQSFPTTAVEAASSDSKYQTIKKTVWDKFEDGLLLLLNLMVSITLPSASKSISSSSSSKSASSTSTAFSSHSQNSSEFSHGTQSSGTNNNNDISHLKNPFSSSHATSMDSQTSGLLTKVKVECSSCHSCPPSQLRNVTALYWFDGCSSEWLTRACFVDSITERPIVNCNPLSFDPRMKHSATAHYSQREAVTVDTIAASAAKRTRTLRYSESPVVVVAPSPTLNSRQVAIDLHWQSGGTGETDQSLVNHRFNSTPLWLGKGDHVNATATKFTLTENLLLYANSLLTMAF